MIKQLLFPFDRVFNVAFISDEIENCLSLQQMLSSFFDSSNTVLSKIDNIQYSKEGNAFAFIVNNNVSVRFTINNQSSSTWTNEGNYNNHDVLFYLFPLDKYTAMEYDKIASETDNALMKIAKRKTPTIIGYLNTECIIENEINNELEWQKTTNGLHNLVLNPLSDSDLKLNKKGKQILQGLFKVFNYHSKNQEKFLTTNKVNFFHANSEVNSFHFGMNEFVANILMQLLTFDKLNQYTFKFN